MKDRQKKSTERDLKKSQTGGRDKRSNRKRFATATSRQAELDIKMQTREVS